MTLKMHMMTNQMTVIKTKNDQNMKGKKLKLDAIFVCVKLNKIHGFDEILTFFSSKLNKTKTKKAI